MQLWQAQVPAGMARDHPKKKEGSGRVQLKRNVEKKMMQTSTPRARIFLHFRHVIFKLESQQSRRKQSMLLPCSSTKTDGYRFSVRLQQFDSAGRLVPYDSIEDTLPKAMQYKP
ncbi:hypothetical protein AOLI_G00187740 [Acnodon oligacanthus]